MRARKGQLRDRLKILIDTAPEFSSNDTYSHIVQRQSLRAEWMVYFHELPPELEKTQLETQEWVKMIAKHGFKLPEAKKEKQKVRFENDKKGGISIITEKDRPSNLSTITEEDLGWIEIEVTIDSGACDTVMPASMCSHISILQTEESRRGMEYEVANGETVLNLGARYCLLMSENSKEMKRITFQCADIHKPLLSVSRISDLGYDCILTNVGGKLRDRVFGETMPLHRRGNLYVMQAWIRQDKSSFTRPR